VGDTLQSLFSFLTEKMTKKKEDKVIEIDDSNLTNEVPRNGPPSNETSKYLFILLLLMSRI
jgi:hypothetical protein